MAIAEIKKIELLGLREDKDKILLLLQNLGLVQLMNLHSGSAPIGQQADREEFNLLETEEVISYLATFKEQAGFLGGMILQRPQVLRQQLEDIISTFDYKDFFARLLELRNRIKNLQQHKERIEQERNMLIPWRNLKIPLDQLHGTKNYGIVLGVVRSRDYSGMFRDCTKAGLNLFWEAANRSKTNTYIAILYLQDEFERLDRILKTHHFNFITLTRHKCSPLERLFEINREVMVWEDQIQDTRNKITRLAADSFKLMAVHDYFENIKRRQEADTNTLGQQFTFGLSGWVRKNDLNLLEKKLTENFKDIALFVAEPKPDEEPPVILENKRLIQPFEFITSIYGMPKYNELDPTPFLAPFFFLYFGFCVSDAGYGFILALFSLFVLKKFKMGPQGLKFFRLFLLCGISTIIVGALTGSWFGNLFDMLAQANRAFIPLQKFKDSLIILDPLKEPTKLLAIALCLGIVQVWFGTIVAAIGNIKNKRYLDVALDQVSMVIFLFGLTGLGLIFLKILGSSYAFIFNYSALSGAILLVLTQGRSEKTIGAKLFYGAYNLYNSLSGYLSDVLSYSRLWALGLVTGVMASTVNLISVQFSQIIATSIPFIQELSLIKLILSTLILVFIFIAGHLMSFLMNLLGAFVHPTRLQFVEFFSKFFKPGGSPFRPFKIETRYTNIT